ncbi:MAG: hypothetical protein EHM13_11970 [Acidobacteria bacterium]|nr:MAG: hypothetical protein EHM13_11970 [Acidobacteriota bacterium]
MKTAPWLLGVLVLAAGLALPGCKGQPEKPKFEPVVKAPAPVAPSEPAPWQWPLSNEKLAQLLAMPSYKRGEIMPSMIPPAYEVRRTTAVIRIDGDLGEDDWALARTLKLREVVHGTP